MQNDAQQIFVNTQVTMSRNDAGIDCADPMDPGAYQPHETTEIPQLYSLESVHHRELNRPRTQGKRNEQKQRYSSFSKNQVRELLNESQTRMDKEVWTQKLLIN